jgi:hypothetical protein
MSTVNSMSSSRGGVPKALFLCVEELSGKRYTHARDRWIIRPATPEESGLLELAPGTTVIHLVHTAYDENGAILEVSESVWPADRIIILDDWPPPRSGHRPRDTRQQIRRSTRAVSGSRLRGSAATGGGSVAASSGRKPCVAAAASRGLPAPGRCRCTPQRLVTTPARADRPSSSRQPSCYRRKITVKGVRCAHVADAMALRATLDTDLLRQEIAPIRRTRDENRACLTLNRQNAALPGQRRHMHGRLQHFKSDQTSSSTLGRSELDPSVRP